MGTTETFYKKLPWKSLRKYIVITPMFSLYIYSVWEIGATPPSVCDRVHQWNQFIPLSASASNHRPAVPSFSGPFNFGIKIRLEKGGTGTERSSLYGIRGFRPLSFLPALFNCSPEANAMPKTLQTSTRHDSGGARYRSWYTASTYLDWRIAYCIPLLFLY